MHFDALVAINHAFLRVQSVPVQYVRNAVAFVLVQSVRILVAFRYAQIAQRSIADAFESAQSHSLAQHNSLQLVRLHMPDPGSDVARNFHCHRVMNIDHDGMCDSGLHKTLKGDS